jgi:hypothetical protein
VTLDLADSLVDLGFGGFPGGFGFGGFPGGFGGFGFFGKGKFKF